jgi:RND family efflux transporter MFP subunit
MIRDSLKPRSKPILWSAVAAAAMAALVLAGCGGGQKAAEVVVTVAVTPAVTKPLARNLTVSAELVPFQEIDVYAKESGYVRELNVDYGSRVKAGQIMAVLEIPELEMQLHQDSAAIASVREQVANAEHELNRVEAQQKVIHLQSQRLSEVAQSRPGLVAPQEVDDAQGKDLAGEAQVEAGKSALEAAKGQLLGAQAKLEHDQILYDYSRIRAPFAGVVTQRYANLGALLQAGTTSSTQAMPLVKLSEDSRFRLVIPVPEAYVRYIQVGDPVQVKVPALDRDFPGKVTRFAEDVRSDTRTMHTEVDVENPDHLLIPGMYAEANLSLDRKPAALAIPLQAISQEGNRTFVDVVDATGHIVERPVEIGIRTANDAEVLSGLSAGQQVVVSDRGGLKPGELVHAQPANPTEVQGGG